MTLEIPANGHGRSGASGIVTSDDFDREPGEPDLPLAWQWNHNPDDRFWSVEGGELRLRNGRVADNIEQARNTLTQRTFGPTSTATVRLDGRGMLTGDVAALTVFASDYGYVGLTRDEDGLSIVMVRAENRAPVEVARVPVKNPEIWLRASCDFENRADTASFSYSLDGEEWTAIGEQLRMRYTLDHFMGYRFGLSSFATEQAGGSVAFDDFRLNGSQENADR